MLCFPLQPPEGKFRSLDQNSEADPGHGAGEEEVWGAGAEADEHRALTGGAGEENQDARGGDKKLN